MSGDIVAGGILAAIYFGMLIVVALAPPIECYAAVCGGQVLAASLTTPKRGHGRSCRRERAHR